MNQKIMNQKIKDRLEHFRVELRAERISYGELAELQSLAGYIEKGDVELLEPAGVPEYAHDINDATPLDFHGFLCALEEAKKAGTQIPAWLCTNDSVRDARKNNALEQVKKATAMGWLMSEGGVIRAMLDIPEIKSQFERWKEQELELKRLRESDPPNPLAFFWPS